MALSGCRINDNGNDKFKVVQSGMPNCKKRVSIDADYQCNFLVWRNQFIYTLCEFSYAKL